MTTDQGFDNLRGAIIRQSKAKVLREARVKWDGLPALEIVVESPEINPPAGGVTTMRLVISLARNRMYLVTAAGPKGTDQEKDVKAFLESFHLKGKRK